MAFVVMTAGAKAKKEAAPQATKLTVENMQNPLGLQTHTPRFSWQLSGGTRDDSMQKSYRILVASAPELLLPGKADLWDTGDVMTDASLWIAYNGKPLKDNDRAYWTVQVTTTNGVTEWAEAQSFGIGLTVESHWKGRWIGADQCFDGENQGYRTRLAARYLRNEIQLKGEVKRATAYVAAVGLYEFYVNGEKQGDDVMAPNPTDTRKSIIYNTFDITAALQPVPVLNGKAKKRDAAKADAAEKAEQKACLGIVLGNGRAFPMRQSKPYKCPFMGFPKCRINVIVEYVDGTQQTFSTDEKWLLTANGPIRSNNEYDGEEYDARMILADETGNPNAWAKVGYDASKWQKAERTDIPQAELIGQPAPNMTAVKYEPSADQEIKLMPHNGNTIVDFGQNMAGWVQLKMHGNAGDTIRIKFAEKLNPDGSLYLDNFRDALSEDVYVCSGKESGAWHPTFVTHGFRFVEIKGMADVSPSDVAAYTVSDRMDRIGEIETSNEVLNKVYRNARWGIYSNYKGMPVDCPQRNERQPWLGDRTVGSLGESYIFNNERLYTKWMRDICESQRTDGVFSDVAPAFWNYYNDDVTWPAVLPFTSDMLFEQYGNDEAIRFSYPYIKKWLNHVFTEYLVDGIVTKDQYGDWCVPPEDLKLIHSQDPARQTDGTLISTAYAIRTVRLMQKFAKMQGITEDIKVYADLEKTMTDAFNRRFLTVKRGTSLRHDHMLYPDSVFYGNNSATSNLLPLALGIVPQDCKEDVVNNLIKNIITDNNGHVSCGVIGISWLMRVLSDNGRADVAYLLASNKSYPSWGYMAEQGATTIWELWNGDTANPRMNSGNHVMLLGDLLTWYYQYLGGIRSTDAYKHITLKPSFEIQDLDYVNASYNTPYGPVVSNWKKTLERVHWEIVVPANTYADVYLPNGEVKHVQAGKYVFDVDMPMTTENGATVTEDEFVYDNSIYPETHAASIIELPNGDLMATYFGGTKERNPDVCVWVQTKKKGSDTTWSKPVLAADGVVKLGTREAALARIDSTAARVDVGPSRHFNITWDEAKSPTRTLAYTDKDREMDQYRRKACWNPVLFQMPDGEIWLFFKVGKDVADWTGWLTRSRDGGKTWTEKEILPEGFLGPIKNKPEIVGDRMICPSSTEGNGWKLHFEIYNLKTKQWKYVGPVDAELAWRTTDLQSPTGTNSASKDTPDPDNLIAPVADGVMHPIDLIQPSILKLSDGRLQVLCRTRNAKLATSFSSDGGDTWSKVTLTDMPNNQSGTDAVTLSDGRHVLIYNNFETIAGTKKGVRTPLSLAISDDGTNWRHLLTLEDSPIGQYSYPSIIQGKDGSLQCIYTWRRDRISYKRVTLK